MGNYVREMQNKVTRAGGVFVRVTGKGHRRYRLGETFIDVPMRGLEAGHLRANLDSQIRRAIRAMLSEAAPAPVPVKETPRRDDETPTQTEIERAAPPPEPPPSPPESGAPVAGPEPDRPGPGDDEPVVDERRPDRAGAVVCPECGRTFRLPMNLGRHRAAAHRTVRRPVMPEPEIVERRLVFKDVPPPVVAPPKAPVAGPSMVPPALVSSGTDLLARVLERADALQAAVQELAAEHRLLRSENARLRAVVTDMETAFDLIRTRSR